MKIQLDRAEIQQAISCFLKQKGLEHEDFSMTISYSGATIDLNKSSEEEPVAIVEESTEEVATESPAVEAVKSFGSFGGN